MARAFIIHSSPDDRYVDELKTFLRGIRKFDAVFVDSHDIEPDEEFWPRIEQEIRDCDTFVVVLSHASVKSYWVDREVQFARQEGKKVIPVRIDDCKLPSAFAGHCTIDFRHGRDDRVKIALSNLAQMLAENETLKSTIESLRRGQAPSVTKEKDSMPSGMKFDMPWDYLSGFDFSDDEL